MSEEELIEKLSNYLKDSLGKDLIKALKTALDKLQKENEELQKENEELKEQRNKLLQKGFKILTENYIHKDIIKYKINELKKAPVVYSLTIDILEELLEEIFEMDSDIE